jgi:lipopolysaccharide transport system ATP-binding protein
VLAVGDAGFQKKCLGKMGDVARAGRTVLFVSHNMAAIQSLCSKAARLGEGRLVGYGDVAEQTECYLRSVQEDGGQNSKGALLLGPALQIVDFRLTPNPVQSCAQLSFVLELRAMEAVNVESAVILINSAFEVRLAAVDLRNGENYHLDEGMSLLLTGKVRSIPLVEAEYRIHIYAKYWGADHHALDASILKVVPRARYGRLVPFSPRIRGVLELDAAFTVNLIGVQESSL